MVASKKIYDHRPVENSGLNHGHSLLSFMNLASDKVKTALEKPNSFKRNINHRRFLQKQFRAMVKSPEKNPGRRTIARENVDSLNYTLREMSNRQSYPPPLNHNYVRFDPLESSIPNLGFENPNSFVPFDAVGLQSCKRQNLSNTFEREHISNDCLYQSGSSSTFPELGVEEDFLTGEQLTQAIELEDLFIPETDLMQYLLNVKENVGGFCNSDASVENYDSSWLCRDFGLQDDILVF